MIVSVSNEKIKYIRSLKEKKFRDRENLYIVEGVKLVNEAIKKAEVVTIVSTSNCITEEYSAYEVIEVTEKVYKSISDEINPQGILAVVKKPTFKLPKEITTGIVLDKLRDPGNLGTVIRTAVASGYKDLFLIDSVDPFNPKTVRASMGGIFGVNLHFVDYEYFKDIKTPIIIADMKGRNVFNYTSPKSFLLAIGNEANGISDNLKGLATETVSIPMQGNIESLNAGVSAGILMYLLKNNK